MCIKRCLKLKKVSKIKIANVYATALYEASVESGSVDKVKNDVAKLQSLLNENNDLSAYLENPLWSQQDKKDILFAVQDDRLGECVCSRNYLIFPAGPVDCVETSDQYQTVDAGYRKSF